MKRFYIQILLGSGTPFGGKTGRFNLAVNSEISQS